MACSTPDCGNEKIVARGLCGGCYHRMRRGGTVARKYVVNTGSCSVDGCDGASFAKNFCQHHYQQAQHPLNHTWKILRSRSPGMYPPGWDRFETFLGEVGERPGPKYQLRRVDPGRPWGVSNAKWIAPVGKKPQYFTREQQAAYGREWTLQRRYNLTGEQYAEMLAAQGFVCGVCGGVETHTYKSGKVKDLAVDHDHDTKEVRGLLCMNCNQGIGRLGDDPARLRAAAAYLERHRKPRLVCSAAD